MLSLTDTDKLSDAPDIMFDYNLSDKEETIELQSALIPTESAMPVPKLCKSEISIMCVKDGTCSLC